MADGRRCRALRGSGQGLRGEPSWIGWVLDLVWLALLFAFFVWAPRICSIAASPTRDLVPGAVFTVLGLVILRLISVLLLTHWLNWYSTTYGAFGIIIAIFFWIILIGPCWSSPRPSHRPSPIGATSSRLGRGSVVR